MKKTLLPVLILFSIGTTLAQDPVEPCCGIAAIMKDNRALIRNNATGKLAIVKLDALDARSIRLKDPVSASGDLKNITSINGASRVYKAEPVGFTAHGADPINDIRIDGIEVCCSIIKNEVNPAEPCCNIITGKDNQSGANFQISVPKFVAQQVKTGQPLYSDPVNGLVIVNISTGNNGEMGSYGYYMQSGDGSGNSESNARWIITPVSTMKGVFGKLTFDYPQNTVWELELRTPANKFLTSFASSGSERFYNIAPGEYIVKLSHVDIENVPVKKGHETKLITGYLNIVTDGTWELYDAGGKKFLTSGNKPQKIVMPVGNYTFKMGTQSFPLQVKKGETAEF